MTTTARGRAASAAALAVAVCASVAACGPGTGGGGDALPTYVAPSTSTTVPSPTKSGGKVATGSLPSAADLLSQAQGQARVASTVTIRARMPGKQKPSKQDMGPFEVRAEGDAGGGPTRTAVTLEDGSSITQIDRGGGEVYLRVAHGPGGSADVEKGLEGGAKNPLAKRAGTWVRVFNFPNDTSLVPYRPYDFLKLSVRGGNLGLPEQRYGVVDSRTFEGKEVWAVLVRHTTASKAKYVRTLILSKESPPRFLQFKAGRWPTQMVIDYENWGKAPSTFDAPEDYVKIEDDSTIGTFGPRTD